MLNQLLEKWKTVKEKVALIYGQEHYDYAELCRLSSIIANNMYQHGVRKKSRIAFFMDNKPELIWLYFATFSLGAVAVPINYRYKADELAYVLQDCQINILITEESKEQYVEKIHGCGQLNCKVFSISSHVNNIFLNFISLLNEKTPSHPQQKIAPDDLSVILYTSGSTSNPKGVMHSHRSVLAAATHLTQTIMLSSNCINGITLPICHIAGMIGQVISTILIGGQMILFPKFDAKSLVHAIEQYKITHLQLTPANLVELVEYADDHKNSHLTSLLQVIVGGDKVPETLQEKFFTLSHCYVTEVLGMTESFSYCINLSHDKTKLGSAGIPTKGVKIDLLDNQNNIIKTNNQTGEIRVHSNANMLGYWGNPHETIKTLRDGYVYTGDLAYRDQDGFFWFAGRKKQLIIRGGSNISPQEVESVLIQHPLIREVCVIGFPDKKLNQIVCACVVLKDKKLSLTLENIRSFCIDHISDYKIPEKLIILNELPHNTTGKLDRNQISKMTLAKQHN
ncbi:MAG: hypothetical protein A3E83_00130 [Gammaproteobacteria bacterium RIFCSPHIGHO2_12_FULL_41_20]|nr:MAG: hypothetical protein A3E83_00130 [Gammaproteobacteria bacterium RIFCSPHIGHO2_12_FULL_41_20]